MADKLTVVWPKAADKDIYALLYLSGSPVITQLQESISLDEQKREVF